MGALEVIVGSRSLLGTLLSLPPGLSHPHMLGLA